MIKAKNAGKVLLLENIHPEAVEAFESAGMSVELLKTGLDEDELIDKLQDVSFLGIRSATKVTKKVLESAPDLIIIGVFCIGTNQIDLKAAAENGVVVFNAPYANTRSVVELTMAEILSLARKMPERNRDMHKGIWKKSAEGCYEVRGKTLGIIGYGNIGSQLSTMAEAIGMHVCFYDTADKLALGNAISCKSLTELLERSDIVAVHVDGRPENNNLIGAKEFAAMKDGARFINNSRGSVVDDKALAEALKSGKLGGAAADVFPEEPDKGAPFESPLRDLPNIILTPHIGSGTEEAQRNIAVYTANKLLRFMRSGDTTLSVNMPPLQLAQPERSYRLIYIHQNVPGVLAKINSILGESGINVVGQYLATQGLYGYVVVDAEKPYTAENRAAIESLEETVKLRIL